MVHCPHCKEPMSDEKWHEAMGDVTFCCNSCGDEFEFLCDPLEDSPIEIIPYDMSQFDHHYVLKMGTPSNLDEDGLHIYASIEPENSELVEALVDSLMGVKDQIDRLYDAAMERCEIEWVDQVPHIVNSFILDEDGENWMVGPRYNYLEEIGPERIFGEEE